MNKKILITVHYLVEDEKEVFWDKDTGDHNEQVNEAFKNQFPKRIKLTEELSAERYNLIHQPIDYANSNLIECPICKRLVTDTTKPRSIHGIDAAKEHDGVLMCSSCAWEQSFDIKKHKLVSGQPPRPEGARIIQSNEEDSPE